MNLDLSKIKNFLFPKPKIKAIVFDYGGVIEIRDGDLFKEITDYLGVDRKEFRNVYLTLNHLYNVEGREYKEILSMVAKKFNASDEQVAYICDLFDEMDKTWEVNNELVDLIKKLKKNYKIGMLSNFSDGLRQIMDNQGTTDLFDAIVISYEVGYQKPDPKIFDILFDRLGVKSNEVVFIDDSLSSLRETENIGYIPILFTGNQDLKEKFKKLGISF